MTAATMIKQTRISEIIIICLLVKMLYGKSINTIEDKQNNQKTERSKRGYSHYGENDFGSSAHISSGVLQYRAENDHAKSSDDSSNIGHSDGLEYSFISSDHVSGLGSTSHLKPSSAHLDSWSASGLSPGYDVWLETLPNYHGSSALDSSSIHSPYISSAHLGSDQIASTDFSDDSTHLENLQLPTSKLHTKIVSSSSVGSHSHDHDHDTLTISDNVDFDNIADIHTKHYAKSYGK